ncbi:MAG: GNAT family N-acetyltransferase [Paracoccaceae bacterium]
MTLNAADQATAARLLAEAGQYHKEAAALYAALSDDPFYALLEARAVHPSGPHAAMMGYFGYSIVEGERFGRIICAEDGAGASIWTLPLTAEEAARKARDKALVLEACLGPDSLSAYQELNANMSDLTGPLINSDDWYLSILGLHPDHQGRGLGARLVEPVLREAETAGVSTYLETWSPRNKSFYARLGFQELGEITEPLTGLPYWVMGRAAAG